MPTTLFRIIYRRRIRRRRRSAGNRRDYLKNREAARALVHERVSHWRAAYGFTVRKIAIRNQLTRWGSCSKNGNLNFNYRIVRLPPHLADYLIVHELCHLKEFNHSKAFWKLVQMTIPDFRKARKELKAVKFNRVELGGQ